MSDVKEHRDPYKRQFPGLFPTPRRKELHHWDFYDYACLKCGIAFATAPNGSECPGSPPPKPLDPAECERIWRAVKASAESSNTNAPCTQDCRTVGACLGH